MKRDAGSAIRAGLASADLTPSPNPSPSSNEVVRRGGGVRAARGGGEVRAGMKYSRLVLFLRLVFTGLALGLCHLALIDAYGQQDRAQPADVIVALGSRVYPGGRPGPSLMRRTQHAVALYRRGLAPAVLCTGGLGAHPPTEAETACGMAERLGVPESALVLETRSHSTEENALYTHTLMQARGWQTAILVSDGYHLYRAALLFRRAGIIVYPSPAQATAGPMNPVERYGRESRELAALIWYWGKTGLGLPVTDFP
jgi:uncharacterized SAM-binding protein YcdF (DUF218 family)